MVMTFDLFVHERNLSQDMNHVTPELQPNL